MKYDWSRSHDFEYWELDLKVKEAQELLKAIDSLNGSKEFKYKNLKVVLIKDNEIGFDNWYKYSHQRSIKVCRISKHYLKNLRHLIVSCIADALKSEDGHAGNTMKFRSEDGYAEFLNELTVSVSGKIKVT